MRQMSRLLALLGALSVGMLWLLPSVSAAERKQEQRARRTCPIQKPQKFLIRGSFVKHGALDEVAHERALRYRAERYGNVEGFGLERFNKNRAYASAVMLRFMGLPVQLHKKAAPALRCVERYLRRTCTGSGERYTPRAVGGFRQSNTYRGGEVSNHLFGIAIDIDPDRNPCCGCVSPWSTDPACRRPGDTAFQRAALPRCWIDGFERFGFYWLGRDPDLQDTMHFEFLGDPDRLAP